jgi:putative ABC transport system permease protein
MLALVLGGGIRLTAMGLAIGLMASEVMVRSLGTLLFGVKPLDLVTFLGAASRSYLHGHSGISRASSRHSGRGGYTKRC